jgi:ribosomal protein S18 acetylase RimI-like enzyme
MITYTTSLDGISIGHLAGFFVGWAQPRTPQEHLDILRGSDHTILAVDEKSGRVIGFVTALTDGIQSAFIPLLEVLPEFQRQGIGSELLSRMLGLLAGVPCIDLTCDPDLQSFYEQVGMVRSVGMVLRPHTCREGGR